MLQAFAANIWSRVILKTQMTNNIVNNNTDLMNWWHNDKFVCGELFKANAVVYRFLVFCETSTEEFSIVRGEEGGWGLSRGPLDKFLPELTNLTVK